MRRSLRHTLGVLRAAGIEMDHVREASRHTEIVLGNGSRYRVSKSNHPSRRHERGLRSFIRKFSRLEASS
jgi:hypothetical protein